MSETNDIAAKVQAAKEAAEAAAKARSETLSLVVGVWQERQAHLDAASTSRQQVIELLPIIANDYTATEIGEAFGCNTNSVASMLQEARDPEAYAAKKAKAAQKAKTKAKAQAKVNALEEG